MLSFRLPAVPRHILAGLAGFVRNRLVEVTGDRTRAGTDPTVLVVPAEPVFAANSYARARLLRQMHACGLLDDRETQLAVEYFGVAR